MCAQGTFGLPGSLVSMTASIAAYGWLLAKLQHISEALGVAQGLEAMRTALEASLAHKPPTDAQ